MKKIKTTVILIITLLYFNPLFSQTKEQIGQWLSDSLKIKTYLKVNYSKNSNDIETTYFIDYDKKKNVFTFFFVEVSTYQGGTFHETIASDIFQINSNDMVFQNVNDLKRIGIEYSYKPSTPVYGRYHVLLRSQAIINVYSNDKLKEIPDIDNLITSYDSYIVVDEKVSSQSDEIKSVLKNTHSKYDNNTFLELNEGLNNCFEYNSKDYCKNMANEIKIAYKKLPEILIPDDETYIYEAGNALYWMFEFCKL